MREDGHPDQDAGREAERAWDEQEEHERHELAEVDRLADHHPDYRPPVAGCHVHSLEEWRGRAAQSQERAARQRAALTTSERVTLVAVFAVTVVIAAFVFILVPLEVYDHFRSR